MSWYYFKPYVSVAQRRANAQKHAAKLATKGHTVSPVTLEGRTIARTFWGKAWCENLESYSDFANRLPRGRTYVRNGSVIDLQITPGHITALVSGSEIYEIGITIKPLTKKTWEAIKGQCAGQIASMIELLQGKLSQGVMQIITRHDGGLFPAPAEISLDCSCPDWADMCKHVAAVLYGVGARLDEQPELLFVLRQVDHLELIEQAGKVDALPTAAAASGHKTLDSSELADVFGIELASSGDQAPSAKQTPSPSWTKKPVPGKPRTKAAKATRTSPPLPALPPKAPAARKSRQRSVPPKRI